MSLLGIIASSKLTAVPNSYESIATVSVGSDTASVNFTSIPSTYKHLQIRALIRTNRATTTDQFLIGFNSATTTYTSRSMRATGSGSVFVNTNSGSSGVFSYYAAGNSASANVFGVFVADVLDYTSTTKNKVVKVLAGSDNNDNGAISFNSGAWRTSDQAITGITITAQTGENIKANSHFALYGIKD
jgi:hypothetical protein